MGFDSTATPLASPASSFIPKGHSAAKGRRMELAMAQGLNGIREAYTFDDVLLKPGLSDILPSEADIRSRVTRAIPLNIPIIASAMDTVTEARMAIAMAQAGGIGVIHRNFDADGQAAQVRQVKKYESGMGGNPLTIAPDATLADALNLMKDHSSSVRSKPPSPTVVAAAARNRPCASLQASGCATAFSMSLTVIRPTQRY